MNSKNSSIQFLNDAYKSLKRGRYQESVLILEKIVSTEIQDPYPYFLLAIAYLHTNNFEKSERELARVRMIEPHYPPMIQLQVFLELKSSRSQDDILRTYLDMLEKYPNDLYLQKGRKMLSYTESFSELQKVLKLADLVDIPKPPPELEKLAKRMKKISRIEHKRERATSKKTYDMPRPAPRKKLPREKKQFNFSWIRKLAKAVLISMPGLIIAMVVYMNYPLLQQYLQQKKTHPNVDFSRLEGINIRGSDYDVIKTINKNKTDEFYYSSKTLADDFYSAKDLIKKGEFNGALLILNKMYHSNASFMVKEKVNFLIEFIRNIDERTYENISIREVAARPYLYRGYAVEWKGKVANLKERDESMTFTLMIDYHDKEVFSGIAEVFVPSENDISNGTIVIVRGILLEPIGQRDRLYLTAHKIKKVPK